MPKEIKNKKETMDCIYTWIDILVTRAQNNISIVESALEIEETQLGSI
jgi:hypothetical protein